VPEQQALLYERGATVKPPATLGPVLELLVDLAGDARARPHDQAAADRYEMEFGDLMATVRRESVADPDLVPDLVHVLLQEIVRNRERCGKGLRG
jgi:hypothetical protein